MNVNKKAHDKAREAYTSCFENAHDAIEFENTVLSAVAEDEIPDRDSVEYWHWLEDQWMLSDC